MSLSTTPATARTDLGAAPPASAGSLGAVVSEVLGQVRSSSSSSSSYGHKRKKQSFLGDLFG